MIGMALFAVLLSVNFVSCNKDGDSATQPSNEKKLVGMSLQGEHYNDVYDFKYNQDGRISEIQEDYVHSFDGAYEQGVDIYKYNWHSKDSVTVTQNGELEWSFYLSDGKIIRLIDYDTESGREELSCFTYDNNGHLESDSYDTYTWENDKLLRYDDNYIRYSNTTCKGFFPLFCENIGLWQDYLFMVHPELVGAKTIYLPTEIGYGEVDKNAFSYEFDTDGYVTSCTVIEYDRRSGSWRPYQTFVYEFVWE